MRVYTAHLLPDRAPVLVREGFSWPACIFGVFYFAWHRAWNAAAVDAAVFAAAALGGAWCGSSAPVLGAFVLQGVLGHDLLRWGLSLHGYVPGPVVAARDEDGALARLLEERADMLGDLSGWAEARL